MGKRSAVVELFLGDMGSIQRETRPSVRPYSVSLGHHASSISAYVRLCVKSERTVTSGQISRSPNYEPVPRIGTLVPSLDWQYYLYRWRKICRRCCRSLLASRRNHPRTEIR